MTTEGLGSIPEAWFPRGTRPAHIDTSYGSDDALITRTEDRVTVDCDHAISPDVTIEALDARRVRVVLDLPFPLPNIEARGPLEFDGYAAHLSDEKSERSADMWRLYDGRVYMEVHQPGKKDVDVIVSLAAKNSAPPQRIPTACQKADER
jgi:hypothetical protein